MCLRPSSQGVTNNANFVEEMAAAFLGPLSALLSQDTCLCFFAQIVIHSTMAVPCLFVQP